MSRSDAPDLDAQHLRQALTLLNESPSDVVLGPSPDGGFYLLATLEPLAAELEEIRWCRRDTRRCLERALHRLGRRAPHLEPLQDLDHITDVETWLAASTADSKPSWLRRVLSRLLAEWRRPAVHRSLGRPQDLLATATSGRGPPV